ncbi:MAG: AAA family ATPase [Alphaproteobacteria bacterium]|nr:AAA family ATPase [Alphaproteobacteria bacterium]
MQSPSLKSVEIANGKKLRGLRDSKLEFNFPVTVLCGPNSTGKTTFMALSVLAFHDDAAIAAQGPIGWYYDFKYFFGFSDKEKHEEGILLQYDYPCLSAGRWTACPSAWRIWLRLLKI